MRARQVQDTNINVVRDHNDRNDLDRQESNRVTRLNLHVTNGTQVLLKILGARMTVMTTTGRFFILIISRSVTGIRSDHALSQLFLRDFNLNGPHTSPEANLPRGASAI